MALTSLGCQVAQVKKILQKPLAQGIELKQFSTHCKFVMNDCWDRLLEPGLFLWPLGSPEGKW